MKKSLNYVGIDISKLTFDVALCLENGKYASFKFNNSVEGFALLKARLNPETDCCVMEASGPYYLKLAFYLSDNSIAVSVVNPLVIRRFSQMRLMRSKTDKKDAIIIAQYGKAEAPSVWEKEKPYVLELKQMQAYSEQLNKNRTSLMRQMGAFEANPHISKIVVKSSKAQIRTIENQIQVIESEMERIIKEHHKEQHDQLKSIPGIGPKTATALIVLSAGFTKFDNAKQLSSYVGLSPRIFESGTSVKGKVRICKMGMSKIRAMLYLCSWTAKKVNKACRNLYERLLEKGKPKKVALIAVTNKLLKQAFAIGTSGKYYDENNLSFSCL